ncbi:MAG: chemotaxis protein CheW [Deltaproteobacteria bacterium]|nr:chemotaxis protein CheW [Deltaproteobacteria bacterium]
MSIDGNDAAQSSTSAGKYMTFKLADEEYGLEILKVREIIRLMEITRVPRTCDFMRGVINLRGKVIPVVDLRLKFGMEKTAATDQTVIIVVQYLSAAQELTIGVLVDEVLEVLSIGEASIEPPPSFGSTVVDARFILGVGKAEGRIIFLLDIGKVLSSGESEHVVERAAASGAQEAAQL